MGSRNRPNPARTPNEMTEIKQPAVTMIVRFFKRAAFFLLVG